MIAVIALAVPSLGRAAARDQDPILGFDTDVPMLTSDVLNDHSTAPLDIRAIPQDAPQSEPAVVPLPSALASAAPVILLLLATTAVRGRHARRLRLFH